jgi:hypothetical protein
MTRRSFRALGACAVLLCFGTAAAQSQRTAHTFKLDDPDNPPAATLADASMLVGSWTGTAFGGTHEEVWNPPSAGSMVGLFKLMHDGEVSMYEILLLTEEEGTLNLKVKHFNADFSAWEDKKDHVTFRFIKADEDALHFSGISFYRINDNEMHAYIAMRSGDEVREEQLVYHRATRE